MQARLLALSILRDEQAGYDLLMKACALATRKRADNPAIIKNIPAYLFQTFRHLLLDELERENRHRRQEAEMTESLLPTTGSDADNLDRKILLQQIFKRMDEPTRRIFRYLILGYTFVEIGEKLGRNPDVLRATFHKQIQKLKKQLARTD